MSENKQKILMIDACVREQSRTRRLAEYLLSKLDGNVERIELEKVRFPHMDQQFLNMRDQAAAADDHSADVFAPARQFAAADVIVIAAPFWDLSFPASLKEYIEQINVVGLTFRYTEEGLPEGLCKANKLYYVMTAGGAYLPEEFGFGYVKALAQSFYGIQECVLIKAVGLDIVGADVEGILAAAEHECVLQKDL